MQNFIGTAGWTVPKQHLELFPAPAPEVKSSHLERYAGRLRCVEINSSFYRPHQRKTWERWAATVPEDFRFAVKMAKTVTHTAKLANTGAALLDFFQGVHGLSDKLGPVLVQLPPSLAFDEAVTHEFFTTLRELHSGSVVIEPRHASWFTAAVDQLLRGFEVARVAADPAAGSSLAAHPGGWTGLGYWRLHGSPRTYYSDYGEPQLEAYAEDIRAWQDNCQPNETWVIFDNTALGHASRNAMQLSAALQRAPSPDRTVTAKTAVSKHTQRPSR